ncbi:hypothetical protein [Amphritea sp. HPY]|uniref:hypothetical protein n=1 Tax=Amphritea sp. HPY TaxID=3421652 RepID=UPI003D7DD382
MIDPKWDRQYTQVLGAFPLDSVKANNWPTVNRIDNVYGDRNLFCACPLIESYTEEYFFVSK